MAKAYEFSIHAHSSIYESKQRKMNIYFSEPQKGINSDTGMVLLIPGFGANPKSNVYIKMRDQFADKHNVVTIQCDYFGSRFINTEDVDVDFYFNESDFKNIFTASEVLSIYNQGNVDYKRFLQLADKYGTEVICKAQLDETLAEFNDMGIMQAVDNITAVLAVKAIISDNNMEFNEGKIIIYGHSHGAYLAYLCNAFAPKLFSAIIDNSAWLFPEYMRGFDRVLSYKVDSSVVKAQFDYLAKKIAYDNEMLFLEFLYKTFENECNIISFHGIADAFNNFNEKEIFCNKIKKCMFNGIVDATIDGVIFKSTSHGLDADFLKLFDFVVEKYGSKMQKKIGMELVKVHYKTDKHVYEFDYTTGFPVVKVD